jgi:hypothetical protein
MIRILGFVVSLLGLVSVVGCGDTSDQLKQSTNSKLAGSTGGGTGTCAVRMKVQMFTNNAAIICPDEGFNGKDDNVTLQDVKPLQDTELSDCQN